MNRIYRNAFVVLTAVAGMALAACTNEYSYDAVSASGEQVYFGSDLATTIETPKSASSFAVTVRRINTQGELTVPVTITQGEGSIYTAGAQQVTFADGAAEAPLTFSYNPDDVVYGTYYNITVALNDSTLGSPYGKTVYTFKAGATAWVDFGTATYREDIVGIFYGVGNQVYNVPIQRNTVDEGYYRLVNPYGKAFPYNEPGDYDDSQAYYLTVNAVDPDYVYVEKSPSGMDWGSGAMTMSSIPAYIMEMRGISLDETKAGYGAYFGKLRDGVITMPAGAMLLSEANYNDGAFYQGGAGLFAIALPGYAIADFSSDVTYAGVFTDVNSQVFAVGNLTLGDDAPGAQAVVVEADADASAVADAIVSGELEATSVQAGAINVPIPNGMTGKLQMVVVVVVDGELKSTDTVEFEYYGGGAEPWTTLGTGYYTDDIVVPLFSGTEEGIGQSYTYEVTIQESNDTPGLYRLKNLYAPVAEGFGEEGGNQDILVHAEVADGVYITDQPIGLDFGYGPMSIETDAGYYVSQYDFETVYEQLPEIFATLQDGVISFPILESEQEGGVVNYQAWLNMGENSYFGGMNGELQIILPGASAAARAKAKRAARATSFEQRLYGKAKANGKQNMRVRLRLNAQPVVIK